MQCIEPGCSAPQHYPITERCILHSIEFTATSWSTLRSTTPYGHCRVPACSTPAPVPQRGMAPIHCPEHTREWVIAKTASQRRRKEYATFRAMTEGTTCAQCGDLWKLDPTQDTARVPATCPDCRAASRVSLCQHCGCAVERPRRGCDPCKEARRRASVVRTAERAKASRASRPPEPCCRCGNATAPTQLAKGYCPACRAQNTAARRRETRRLRDFRERLFTTMSFYESLDVDYLIGLLDSPCRYCGSVDQITIEHVVPLIKGGTHTISNVVPACWRCNSSKQDLTLEEWVASGRAGVPETPLPQPV